MQICRLASADSPLAVSKLPVTILHDMTGNPSDSNLRRWLAVGWAAAIALIFLYRYDAWQFPILLGQALPAIQLGPYFNAFWRERLLDAGKCAAVLTTAFAAGSVLIHRLTKERNLLTGLFALAAGLWLLATGVLIIAEFSVAHTGWIFLLAGGWLLPAPRAYFHRAGKFAANPWLALIVIAALLGLLGAMAPPFEYDELEYHLGAPSEYLKAGRIIFLPHNFYSNMPQLTEMLYLLVRCGTAAKMLHWCFGVLSALAIFAVASRLWSQRTGIMAAALFYCLPFVFDLSQTARIDLATTFFVTLTFGGVLTESDGYLSALAAGAAIATKWTAIPVVLLPVILKRRWFCLLSPILCLPWLLKNWLLTGNPVYPMFSWSHEQATLFAAKHYAHFDAVGFWQIAERIWHYSFVETGAVPVLLMTAPLAVLVRGDNRLKRTALLFGAAYAGWYLLTFRPWRFLMPALPLAAMLGAVALDSVARWCRALVVVVMLVGLTWIGLQVAVDLEDPGRLPAQVSVLNLVLGRLPEQEFLSRLGHGIFETVVWMNANLPVTAKVLYVGEARVALAQHAVVWATAFDRFPVDATNGVTHVYFNYSELNRLHGHYGYPRGLDLAMVQAHLGREIHRTNCGAVFEWAP